MKRQSIAVIGGGAAGTTLAWHMRGTHDVTLFEAEATLGGHAYTTCVETPGGQVPVDMAVEYFTERLAPHLTLLLDRFDVGTYVAPLSFAVLDRGGELLWSNDGRTSRRGTDLAADFDRFHRDMIEIVRRGRPQDRTASIGQFLDEKNYSQAFRRDALLPLLATYSGCDAPSLEYSLAYCAVSFNTNLLSFFAPGYWRKARGGIRAYIDRMANDLGERVRLSENVISVERDSGDILVTTQTDRAVFDQVVFATHADQALSMLAKPTDRERALLGGFEYIPVESVLHRDRGVLSGDTPPEYCVFLQHETGNVSTADGTLTRIVGNLPGAEGGEEPIFVSFDPKVTLDEKTVIERKYWKLPKLRPTDMIRRFNLREIQGNGGIWYCGTDTGFGGHEGAVTTALVIADRLGASYPFSDDRLARLQFNAARDLMGVASRPRRIQARMDAIAVGLAERFGVVDRVAYRFAREYLI